MELKYKVERNREINEIKSVIKKINNVDETLAREKKTQVTKNGNKSKDIVITVLQK